MSKHTVRSGDVARLRARFSRLSEKAQVRSGQVVPIIVIQEAGLDGFWIHRLLQDDGIESHVVDALQLRRLDVGGGRRLTKSTARLWCERC